jgi:hypothetical protein
MELPARSGVALASGEDAVTEATTAQLVAWLQAQGLPAERLREAERLDQGLRGFRRTLLRYGLVKALLDKGYEVAKDAQAWEAFDAAVQRALAAREPA